ncbi:MAG TPA: alpha/beta hydrolase, partial [Gammaproteobacteria bacterium]|nr:alpha/beta hydrolase [Gammaproteobacteria bacterium]
SAVLQAPDLKEIAENFLRNWFPAAMLDAGEPAVEPFRSMLVATDPQGLAGSYAAVRDTDMRRTIALIPRPTLVIAGRYDTVTALSHSQVMADTIPNARLLILPAVHLPNIEYPAEYLEAVLAFLRD